MAREMSTTLALASLLGLVAVAAGGRAAKAPIPRGCPTGTSNYTYGPQTLPLPYDGYMPAIDNETMFLHSVRHVGAALTALNGVLARNPRLRDLSLTEIVTKVGTRAFSQQYNVSAADSTSLRNNAGSVWNHGLFWRVMTTYNSSQPAAALTPELSALIASTFGNATALLDQLRAAAAGQFGSGWAWLVVRDEGSAKPKLAIVATPNQDNPLMRGYTPAAARGVPILGVDVWEHAYYLKYRNVRGTYLSMWVGLVDWAAVQRNFELATSGEVDKLYC